MADSMVRETEARIARETARLRASSADNEAETRCVRQQDECQAEFCV